MNSRFWLEDLSSLFHNTTFLPSSTMTEAERLNTLTRLVLIITLILFIFRVGSWYLFLIFGLITVIILYFNNHIYNSTTPSPPIIESYRCNYRRPKVKTSKKSKNKNTKKCNIIKRKKLKFNIRPRSL